MKVYYHIQLGVMYDHGILTAVYETDTVDSKLDIKTTLKDVCKQLNEEMKIDVDVNSVQVVSDKKKPIQLDTKLDTLADCVDLSVCVLDDANKSRIKYEKTMISQDTLNQTKPSPAPVQQQIDVEDKTALDNAKKFVSKNRNDLALSEYLDLLKRVPNNLDALFGAAYIYYHAKRYEESLPYFEKVIGKTSISDYQVLLDYSHALAMSGENDNKNKAISVVSRCINDLKRSNQPPNSIHDANVALANVLEEMGQLQHAFQLYLSVSQMTDKQHVDGLLGYARIGYKLGQVSLDDVFIVVLNAIAQRKNDEEVQRFFTEMVQQQGGFDSLQKQMHAAWTDAPAVVYIATFLRENGALNECMKMLEHAYKLAPNSIDIALLTVHVNENLCTFNKELKFAADFCDGKLDRQVIRKCDLSPVIRLLRAVLTNDTATVETLVSNELSPEKESKTPMTGGMANLELQMLALYFTIVKTCFVLGHLKILPVFVKLIDPLLNVQKDLHKTLIKNEYAYYACICQIYLSCPPMLEVEEQKKVYVIGDSHVLPLAWRDVDSKDGRTRLNPVLVTGLKVWHLRPESKFYTTYNFENALKGVPNGSSCIFILGEIDCREGITKSVENCKYDNEEEAITKLTEIYIKKLGELSRRKKLKIFVHPAPPVLVETTRMVVKFNKILKEAVTKSSKLTWLDFVGDLIDDTSGVLKEEYNFDGVHLNPNYVKLLENNI